MPVHATPDQLYNPNIANEARHVTANSCHGYKERKASNIASRTCPVLTEMTHKLLLEAKQQKRTEFSTSGPFNHQKGCCASLTLMVRMCKAHTSSFRARRRDIGAVERGACRYVCNGMGTGCVLVTDQ